jgi:hypothetical protein
MGIKQGKRLINTLGKKCPVVLTQPPLQLLANFRAVINN